jgi:multiple sugar transport system permease protein
MASRVAAGARRESRSITHTLLIALAYFVFGVFVLFPLVWILLMSFKTFGDIIAYPPKFIFTPTIENYTAIMFGESGTGLGDSVYVRFVLNSIVISGGAVLLSFLVGIPAAYALARAPFRWKNHVAFTFLSFRFAPELAVILPLFVIYKNLGLYDSYGGMILVHQLITLPLVIWIMIGFFQSIPGDIEAAAMVDGANRWQTLYRVALPMVRPGIASALIIAFIFSWNNLTFGLVLSGGQTQPVTVGILQTMNFDQIKWGLMAAAAVIAAIPGIIVAIYAQQHLTRGLTMGAV